MTGILVGRDILRGSSINDITIFKGWGEGIKSTSLKIFKHYKLKPSFSIIKDEKAKNKVGWGTSPNPKFQQFDQV